MICVIFLICETILKFQWNLKISIMRLTTTKTKTLGLIIWAHAQYYMLIYKVFIYTLWNLAQIVTVHTESLNTWLTKPSYLMLYYAGNLRGCYSSLRCGAELSNCLMMNCAPKILRAAYDRRPPQLRASAANLISLDFRGLALSAS